MIHSSTEKEKEATKDYKSQHKPTIPVETIETGECTKGQVSLSSTRLKSGKHHGKPPCNNLAHQQHNLCIQGMLAIGMDKPRLEHSSPQAWNLTDTLRVGHGSPQENKKITNSVHCNTHLWVKYLDRECIRKIVTNVNLVRMGRDEVELPQIESSWAKTEITKKRVSGQSCGSGALPMRTEGNTFIAWKKAPKTRVVQRCNTSTYIGCDALAAQPLAPRN